jgi:hypothetical protein
MTLKFNPPKQVARYALFVDHGQGRGAFKIYNDLGSVKNAYRFAGHGRYDVKILENVAGEWYTLFDIPKGTAYADLPWVKEVRTGGWYANRLVKRAVPMTREEYAEWRLQVERERIESTFDISLANL